MSLSLSQQRALLLQLLQDVEAKIKAQAPPPPNADEIESIEMSFEEVSLFEWRTTVGLAPVIEIDQKGIATLSNIDHVDLRTLLTHASLYDSDHAFKPVAVRKDSPFRSVELVNAQENQRYALRSRVVSNVLNDAMGDAIDEHNTRFHAAPARASKVAQQKSYAKKGLELLEQGRAVQPAG